ncbi:MAG: 7-carboxy-7-deazaguanine synthase QueE [Polyangiaceae bacterium]|nr:7-carboxy-7-deazaguanine synthase QueE [Polyangiaceae bacterium]
MPSGPALEVSELFDSLQGEGVSAGAPSRFLRLAGCNLACAWCDTRYSWDWARFDRGAEARWMTLAELAERLASPPGERLVVTGGEPLLQREALAALAERLDPRTTIELETNGTLEPGPQLLGRVDQWNVSPKLTSAGGPELARVVPPALRALRDSGRAWLKLVVQAAELEEAAALVASLGWPAGRVLLMARGATRAALAAQGPAVAAAALARGWRYSPRLHVELWGSRRGV